ncbi:hypothetical protein [Rhizobium ruizarguesonis]|uniref:hypothetical protein n=1 Tax=Rhizobium ruizarguesonis TaxID=2081791 RepID=UPI001030D41D|nr:hypothetical protein [Rhizobium ruizarguesonis]TAV04561.1 hypothetical protein ELI39_04270 [Rhizobium ruizarguesonis]
MNQEIAGRLRAEYEYLWHPSMEALPDGWIEPLVIMLEKMYRLSTVGPASFASPGLVTWVNLRLEVGSSSASAFAMPIMAPGKWTPTRALECVEALLEFHGSTQETCSICGSEGHLRMRILGSSSEGVFCDQHNPEAANEA